MNKNILTALCILIIVVGVGTYFFERSKKSNDLSNLQTNNQTDISTTGTPTASTTIGASTTAITASSSVKATSTTKATTTAQTSSTKHTAWLAFQSYLTAAKNHDLAALKNYSYRISGICSDSNQQAQCFGLMDNVYAVGKNLKESDFYSWSDAKQVILYTDFHLEEDTNTIGYVRSMIYFIYDGSGNPKVLGLNPSRSVAIKKNNFTRPQMIQALLADIKDTDQDGLEDVVENCAPSSQQTICKKTDPNKRDTNGNGFWDSIDVLLGN